MYYQDFRLPLDSGKSQWIYRRLSNLTLLEGIGMIPVSHILVVLKIYAPLHGAPKGVRRPELFDKSSTSDCPYIRINSLIYLSVKLVRPTECFEILSWSVYVVMRVCHSF
jgi:hypothetical protein